jgi:hypothetical protein
MVELKWGVIKGRDWKRLRYHWLVLRRVVLFSYFLFRVLFFDFLCSVFGCLLLLQKVESVGNWNYRFSSTLFHHVIPLNRRERPWSPSMRLRTTIATLGTSNICNTMQRIRTISLHHSKLTAIEYYRYPCNQHVPIPTEGSLLHHTTLPDLHKQHNSSPLLATREFAATATHPAGRLSLA